MKLPKTFQIPRSPDFVITNHIGEPYLKRWYVWPINKFFNCYLHNICSSDDDRALHDHRADNISILLKGVYLEHFEDGVRIRKAPRIIYRKAEKPHRLELLKDPYGKEFPTWSLFIKMRDRRQWGFWCGERWVHWKNFVTATEGGNTMGKGCDE